MSAIGIGVLVLAVFLGYEALTHLRSQSVSASGAPASSSSSAGGASSPALGGLAPPSGDLTGRMVQVYKDLIAAGANSSEALNGALIAGWESQANPSVADYVNTSDNPNTPPEYVGTHDRGLFQFNSLAFRQISDSCAHNYQCSISAFLQVIRTPNSALPGGIVGVSPWNGDITQRSTLLPALEAALGIHPAG